MHVPNHLEKALEGNPRHCIVPASKERYYLYFTVFALLAALVDSLSTVFKIILITSRLFRRLALDECSKKKKKKN